MQVVLENISSEPEIPESAEPEAVEAPPETQEPADAEEAAVAALEPTAPAPKKRPKPKAAQKPRAPPVEDSADSSDVGETIRNVYSHVANPDMETTILQFLVNRKQAESTRRRELWGRLAQM